MTKSVFSMCILLTLITPTLSWANAACLGYLKEITVPNPSSTTDFLDPSVRFYISRNNKIDTPLSTNTIPLKSTESTRAKWNQNGEKSLDPIFEALKLEGSFYSINTPSLIGYLKSLSFPSTRQGQTVQFVFWEGRGAEIQSSSVVKGTLLGVSLVHAKPRAQDKMETVDHLALTIQETNATGELLNTQVKIPLALTTEKYRTVSPPQNQQGQFSNYHWGLLLGIK